MSEAGWRAFLAAGLDDWVVLHGGAMAVYAVGSLTEGAEVTRELAAVRGFEESGVLVTLGDRHLAVRLPRGVFRLEEADVDLARRISETAEACGLVADRSRAQEVQLAVAVVEPGAADVGFWRAVLGYQERAEDNGHDPLGHGSTFWVQDLDPAKPLRHAMHVDVSLAREHAQARLAAALAAGGRVVAESREGELTHWVLADRAGNKVCIAPWPDGG